MTMIAASSSSATFRSADTGSETSTLRDAVPQYRQALRCRPERRTQPDARVRALRMRRLELLLLPGAPRGCSPRRRRGAARAGRRGRQRPSPRAARAAGIQGRRQPNPRRAPSWGTVTARTRRSNRVRPPSFLCRGHSPRWGFSPMASGRRSRHPQRSLPPGASEKAMTSGALRQGVCLRALAQLCRYKTGRRGSRWT
jgi:hypothetical protein